MLKTNLGELLRLNVLRRRLVPILGVAFVDTVDLLRSFRTHGWHFHVWSSENKFSDRLKEEKRLFTR